MCHYGMFVLDTHLRKYPGKTSEILHWGIWRKMCVCSAEHPNLVLIHSLCKTTIWVGFKFINCTFLRNYVCVNKSQSVGTRLCFFLSRDFWVAADRIILSLEVLAFSCVSQSKGPSLWLNCSVGKKTHSFETKQHMLFAIYKKGIIKESNDWQRDSQTDMLP